MGIQNFSVSFLDVYVVGVVIVAVGYFLFKRSQERASYDVLALRILNTPQMYPALSAKSRVYMQHLVTASGVTHSPVFISCVTIKGIADYLTMAGHENVYISMPGGDVTGLNMMLEKDALSPYDIELQRRIAWLVGHELQHAKLFYERPYFSVLRIQGWLGVFLGSCVLFAHVLNVKFTVMSPFEFLVFVGILWFGIEQWAIGTNRVQEELQCDLNASQDPAILQAGARHIQEKMVPLVNHICSQKVGVQLYNRMPRFWTVLLTHHSHPLDRARWLFEYSIELQHKQ